MGNVSRPGKWDNQGIDLLLVPIMAIAKKVTSNGADITMLLNLSSC